MDVLIVVDMQNDFIDGSLGTDEALNILNNVKEKINKFKGKIIYTMDTHNEDYLETSEGKNLPVKHCIKGTSGWEIREDIYDGHSEIIEKNTFGSIDLVKRLEEIKSNEKINSIEIIGICTDICVISNAILVKTAFPEIEISVDAKCCSGITDKSHNEALDIMKLCQIDIKGA